MIVAEAKARSERKRKEQQRKDVLKRVANERTARLLKTLEHKEAWRCKCKHIHKKQRAYHALHYRLHAEHCPLYPSMAGEVRWDGKNLGVSLQDLIFLQERKKY